MSRTQDELRRIRSEYARQAQDTDLDALYSLFNPGALFLHTQRARRVLSMFRRITLAPPIARRLAKWAWGVRLLLEWLRLFNTHYLVVIQPKSGNTCRMTAAINKT